MEIRPLSDVAPDAFGAFSGIKFGKAIAWDMGLGTLANGKSANRLAFRELDLSQTDTSQPNSPVSPKRLFYNVPAHDGGAIHVKYDPYDSSLIRQITTPSGFVNIVNEADGNGYKINLYVNEAVEGTGNEQTLDLIRSGYSPWRVIAVKQNNTHFISVSVSEGGTNFVSDLQLVSGTLASGTFKWRVREGDGGTWLRTRYYDSVTSGGQRVETISQLTGDQTGPTVHVIENTFDDLGWGEQLVSTTVDPAGANLTTSYTYHTDSSSSLLGNYRKVKSVTYPDGNWQTMWYYNEWDKRGILRYEFHPFGSLPAAPPTLTTDTTAATALGSGRTVSYTYAQDFMGGYSIMDTRTEKINGVTTGFSDDSFDYITPANDWAKIRVYNYDRQNNSGTNVYSLESRFRQDSTPTVNGLPYFTDQFSKTRTSYSYSAGTWDENSEDGATFTTNFVGPYFRTVAVHGMTEGDGATTTLIYDYDWQSVFPVHLVPGRSTADMVIRNRAGKVVFKETRAFTASSQFQIISWEKFVYDDQNRLTHSENHTGTGTDYIYTGGRLWKTINADGTELTYTYDVLGRVATQTRSAISSTTAYLGAGTYPGQAAVVTSYTYDGANRALSTTVTSDGLSNTVSTTYDDAGRTLTSTAPGPNGDLVTSYAYATLPGGGSRVTATLPGNVTKMSETNRDGSVASVSGTSVVPATHAYSIESTGNRVHTVTSGQSPGITSETEYDWLGNQIAERHDAWGSLGEVESTWIFNNRNQLTQANLVGTAPVLYFYDDTGYLYRTVADINANGTVEEDGSDRITDTTSVYTTTDADLPGVLARVSTTSMFLAQNDDSATQLSKSITRLGPLPPVDDGQGGIAFYTLSTAHSIDTFGNLTTSRTLLDPTTSRAVSITDTPASDIDTVSVSHAGRSMQSQDATGMVFGYAYDALGRLTFQTHPRLGSTETSYYGNTSFIHWVKDYAGNVQKTYTYDAATRVATETNPYGGVVRYDYNDRGQVLHTWGNATYPLAYVYDDDSGRRIMMKTYHGNGEDGGDNDPPNPPASPVDWNTPTWPAASETGDFTADLTVWVHDPATGLLDAKYDAKNVTTAGVPIANAKSVSYTYNAAGQIATRTWARGEVATYAYHSVTGELLSVDYDDPATTDIINTYNRQGQLATVTDATGLRTFTYDEVGQVRSEDLDALHDHRVLTYQFAPEGAAVAHRPLGYTLSNSSAAALHSVAYTYETNGRLDTLTTGGLETGAWTFDYGYQTNSNLISTIDSSSATTTHTFQFKREWAADRNAISAAITTSDSTEVARYDYTYDNMNRRATSVMSGTAFDDYLADVHRHYAYNHRSELVEDIAYATDNASPTATDKMRDRQFAFFYDDIGSRLWSNRAGLNDTRETYTRNELNQYTQRTNDTLAVGGTVASATAKVGARVIGSDFNVAARVQGYWSTTLNPANLTSARKDQIEVIAAEPGAGTTGSPHVISSDSSRTAITPMASQDFIHDDDGNVLDDGLWLYTWDAENRLTAMETAQPAWEFGGVPRTRIEFTYDYLHRRVRKVNYQWQGGVTPWSEVSDRRYTYEGWDLVLEDDWSNNVVRTYTWGLDITGSLKNAGGVAALLNISDEANSEHYLPGYDANGNLTVLLQGSDGTTAATYEYGPFGEALRQEGPSAQLNHFRFSTKYTDDETGLVYYGRRYYDPRNGRFLGRDPLGEEGGINLYAFVANSAVNTWDYLGMYFSAHYQNGVIYVTVPVLLTGDYTEEQADYFLDLASKSFRAINTGSGNPNVVVRFTEIYEIPKDGNSYNTIDFDPEAVDGLTHHTGRPTGNNPVEITIPGSIQGRSFETVSVHELGHLLGADDHYLVPYDSPEGSETKYFPVNDQPSGWTRNRNKPIKSEPGWEDSTYGNVKDTAQFGEETAKEILSEIYNSNQDIEKAVSEGREVPQRSAPTRPPDISLELGLRLLQEINDLKFATKLEVFAADLETDQGGAGGFGEDLARELARDRLH